MSVSKRRSAGSRFVTGVPTLDLILRGGVPMYATVILAGPPGSGKTILAQQMMFANAGPERRALYLSTLSESPLKAARYQSAFSFFDPNKFGDSVVYMDLGQTIRKEGLNATVDVIGNNLREFQPYVVVIDSFKAIHDLANNPREMRTFVYDLAVELAAVQSTAFLVGEYREEEIEERPEFAVADGIIYLHQRPENGRQNRYLRIVKMRGVDHSTADHNFVIKEDGLNLFAFAWTPQSNPDAVRGVPVQTGLEELDELLRGGIPSGSPFLISGTAGTGKTTLALQYLWNGLSKFDDKAVFFTYEELPEQLIANAASFGWDLRPYVESGALTFCHTLLPRINPNEQMLLMERAIRESGARRAVIDSLTMLMGGVDDPAFIRQQVFNLTSILRNEGCTAMIITDPPVGSDRISRFGVEESIIDGVVILRIRQEAQARRRTLEVFKVRGVNHASGEHSMKITNEGIKLFPRVEVLL